ncbi:MAG: tRNA preQ1(34) S-adenosylmethionine ribosyltransferase-isomerase QueA [Clostridia bacterium]|jgi:S-adenosylmethionine:tRNA ribosyltransferase-isomerase|nr:tRNA preQ1(34) S-adenosylmethionine ribosyltransferase-isomerase QueA [Clostridia bacterium]
MQEIQNLSTHDFYYELPEELIAQTPAEPRDSSRLLVYSKDEDKIYHKHFCDVKEFLKAGDLLVINNTRVIPARIFGHIENHESVLETLLLKRIDYTHWETIMKPARKARIGSVINYAEGLSAVVTDVGEYGARTVEFIFDGVFEDILDRVGNMPLPPYIKEKLQDKERYQTVYSKIDGSAAAPTAGLHFTPELMKSIEAMGVEFANVLLHIGLGTFRPVKEDNILNHKMHTEYYEIDEVAANKINNAIREGRRVICVGTTSVRTLETVADENGYVKPCKGETSIFIYPGYKFKCVKGLITNFHLPESTLIMLVSAFVGREKTLEIYKTAVDEKYRFFSFGDSSMFI